MKTEEQRSKAPTDFSKEKDKDKEKEKDMSSSVLSLAQKRQ